MPNAAILPLRVPQAVRARPGHRPKNNRLTGEEALFEAFARWGIAVQYEPFFFPLEFHPWGEPSMGFQPDGYVECTRDRPAFCIELSLAGFCPDQAAIVRPEQHRAMLRYKQMRITRLERYYGISTLMIDGVLFHALVNLPDGESRFQAEVSELFGWQLAA